MTTAAVPTAAVAAVVGKNCDNGNDGSGVDGGDDDGSYGDSKCKEAQYWRWRQQWQWQGNEDNGGDSNGGGGKYNNQLKRGRQKQ
jgi:hypothetical protein